MKYVKCNKDHYYDADQYTSCPYCGGSAQVNETVTFYDQSDDAKTTPLGFGTPHPTVPLNNVVPGVTMPLDNDDDQKTVFLDSTFHAAAIHKIKIQFLGNFGINI